MENFLNNILRYPQFFISSFVGLILIILTPFKNLLKIPKLRIFLIFGLLICFLLLYVIILNMVGF